MHLKTKGNFAVYLQQYLLLPFLQSRQSLLNAANRIGEAQNELLRSMGSPGDVDPRFQVRSL